ncbi:Asp23/Gls24 family envelope stress response protein [Saccharopolyspora phatthalungensis]|uniref:Putative alkaline shock family protein YloU n=1 Tax=Saccharopolyspora phatthalungensis TaxID=664693 RepID=A0A840Q1G1_9PSEU|nr:Asp23/Gls24 family envelope stress response protein [Saccharopolyspora phatthalungensis]MBB5156352.1 putative alkaline shock family protein YloU [Saccharopolyspora phatthalungensis]
MTATAERAAAEDTGDRGDPGERGRLHISRSVLRKIAEYAADQAPGCARTRRRLAGVGLREHGAVAHVSGPDDALRVRLDVALRYPTPVCETVASMRDRVGGELRRIADRQVRTVEVTVSALVPAEAPPRVE